MKKIKTKAELDEQLQNLRNCFGDKQYFGNISELKELLKDHFNKEIIQVGNKMIFDFNALFNMSPEIRKKFKGDAIQPITITYIRLDIIFFKYDKHPEFGEEYIMLDSDWIKWLYPTEIKQSVLWKNKEYLKEKNPNEYYLQVNLFDIKSSFVNYIKDIDFSDYK